MGIYIFKLGTCHAPKFLVDPLEGPSMRNAEGVGTWGTIPTSSTRGGERGVLEVSGKTRTNWQAYSLTQACMKPHKMVRTHSRSLWCWDKPRATRTHKTHHGPDLGGSHHLPPYSILCDSPWGWHPNGHFVPGLPGLPRIFGTPETLRLHNFRSRPPMDSPSEAKL
jgi:hypothetical protein